MLNHLPKDKISKLPTSGWYLAVSELESVEFGANELPNLVRVDFWSARKKEAPKATV